MLQPNERSKEEVAIMLQTLVDKAFDDLEYDRQTLQKHSEVYPKIMWSIWNVLSKHCIEIILKPPLSYSYTFGAQLFIETTSAHDGFAIMTTVLQDLGKLGWYQDEDPDIEGASKVWKLANKQFQGYIVSLETYFMHEGKNLCTISWVSVPGMVNKRIISCT